MPEPSEAVLVERRWWVRTACIVALVLAFGAVETAVIIDWRARAAERIAAQSTRIDALERRLATADEDRGKFRGDIEAYARDVERLNEFAGAVVEWNNTLYEQVKIARVNVPPPPKMPTMEHQK